MQDPFITSLENDGQLIDAALDRVSEHAAVPTCPDWTVRDLILHLGSEHIWVAELLREKPSEALRPSSHRPQESESLREWYRNANQRLREMLAATSPSTPVWNVTGDNVAGSWRRRQAHETAIHRFDLEHVTGRANDIDEILAEAFMDEFGLFLPFLREFRDAPIPDRDIVLSTPESSWTLEANTGEITNGPALTNADVVGSASALVLALWGRPQDADVRSPELLKRWIVDW